MSISPSVMVISLVMLSGTDAFLFSICLSAFLTCISIECLFLWSINRSVICFDYLSVISFFHNKCTLLCCQKAVALLVLFPQRVLCYETLLRKSDVVSYLKKFISQSKTGTLLPSGLFSLDKC